MRQGEEEVLWIFWGVFWLGGQRSPPRGGELLDEFLRKLPKTMKVKASTMKVMMKTMKIKRSAMRVRISTMKVNEFAMKA